MKMVASLGVGLLALFLSTDARAQSDPCELPGVVCGCTADPVTGSCSCSAEALAEIDALGGCAGVDHVVCIDGFQFVPLLLRVAAGDTVAWVNLENGCNAPPGSLTGANCAAQHSVDSMQPPAGPFQDLDSPFLCSPNAATGNPGDCRAPATGVAATNVFCSTYGTEATLHYTCQTNPFHTILMHGAVAPQ